MIEPTSSFSSFEDDLLFNQKSKKEYTYADQYPIFIDQKKFSSVIGKSSSLSMSWNSNNKIELKDQKSGITKTHNFSKFCINIE